MKSFIISIVFALSIFATNDLSAQFFVRIRPIAPVVVVPPIPSPRHVWIPGEWRWNRRRGEYIWRQGFYAVPKPGRVWIEGRWVEGPEGSRWEPGYWRRR